MKALSRAVAALALTMCAITASVAQPVQEKRIALLIGTDTYPDVRVADIQLANVARDLVLLEQSFRRTGFEVEVARNLPATAIRQRLAAFGERARGADVAMVYFTGFGVSVDGVDYLSGADLRVTDAQPADLESLGFVSLKPIGLAVQNARRFGMLILESSRWNPWASAATRGVGTGGLGANELAADAGVIIFYGSQDGSGSQDGPPGGNGPFAAALARHMLTPGLEVGLMARRVRADVVRATRGEQRPTLYGELGAQEFYFTAPPPPPTPTAFVLSQQPRLALVIGNSDYNNDGDLNDDRNSSAVQEQGFAPDLANPANDARDIRAALERIGFQADLVENADYPTLLQRLFEFEQKINDAGEDAIVVIYYAGHAIQVGGANFMVPVGAKLPGIDLDRLSAAQAELALQQYALPMQTALLQRLRNPNAQGLNLVILDACRENPWQRSGASRTVNGRTVGGATGRTRGIAEIQSDLRRTAIAYATRPGDVAADGDGANSPYAEALKAVIEEPGIPVRELLDRVSERVEASTRGAQVPWTNTPALGRTCLGACAIQ